MLPAAVGNSFGPAAQQAVKARIQHRLLARCRYTAGSSMEPPSRPPKVVVITGPTGVGKTAVGLLVAQQLGGEVISADSVQVYKGLDVGSDKLPVSERQGMPHHLIDVCDLTDDYTAGQFHDDGRAAIRDIIACGKLPVVVGGTGFYLRLLVEGKPAAARASPELEQQVEGALQQAWENAATAADLPADPATGKPDVHALNAADKWQAGVALLGTLGDQEAMNRISNERNNYFRLKRALAMLMSNPGRTMKELDVGSAGSAEQYDWRTFFLHRPRNTLYKKVDQRVQEMVLGGLLDEASMLLLQGMQPGSNMACSAVGYRQAMIWLTQAVIDVQESGTIKVTLAELVHAIAAATHRLIRSQMTWFRDSKEFKWLDMEQLGSAQAAADSIMTALQAEQHQGEILSGGGYLDEKERKDHKSREVQLDVLKSRVQDVQQVMQHVAQVLVPQLIASPHTSAAIALERQAREQARREQAEKEQQRQAKRQKRLEQRQATMAVAAMEQQEEQPQQSIAEATQLASTPVQNAA